MELLPSKELVKKFHSFFEEFKRKEIRKAINEEQTFFVVDFFELTEYDPELGDQLLAFPEDIFMLMEQTINQFYNENSKTFIKVRLGSMPITEKIMIRDLRSEHLGKLVFLEAMVRRKTDVRPRLVEIQYQCQNSDCPKYEDYFRIKQDEDKKKTLKKCLICGSPVSLIKNVLIDSQNLVLEEIPEQLDNQGDQPKRINVMLQGDLVSPFKDSKTNPGSRVYVIGLVREIPIVTRTGAESINYDLLVEGNFINITEDDYDEIEISKEEETKIKELASDENVIDTLVENMAPAIYGHKRIKEAILLQLFGGAGMTKGDGTRVRGDIHVLLIGDPGAAKSQMLKAATRIAPRSTFVSGKSASGVGLTASVIKDDLTRGWALEAGALVLASGGLAAIDEMDKMSEDDTSAMHEALEQQTVSIAKANIRATLRCQTTVLGAANPKMGRFDPYGDIAKQINFPPALMSRFDLLFILRDIPNNKVDDMIAEHILQTHKDKKKTVAKLDTDFLKKYISYAKVKIKPILTQEAIAKIKDFYVKIRNSSGGEDGVKSVPITARQLEAIVRLSESYARIKLDKKVRLHHAEAAIDIMMYCLEKIGIDPKTGELDIDRITTGVTATTRNQYKSISDIIDKLEAEKPEIGYEDIIEEASKININKSEVQKMLDKLKQEGIIFEPRKNVYKKLL